MKNALPLLAALLMPTVFVPSAAVAWSRPGTFSPDRNPYAKQIVHEPFQIVEDLCKIDPAVLAAFHAQAPAGRIANHGERFESTDMVTDASLPTSRLLFAGGSPERWFVLYEQGGIGYYLVLTVFVPQGNGAWRLAATATGNYESKDFGGLKTALQKGSFVERTTP